MVLGSACFVAFTLRLSRRIFSAEVIMNARKFVNRRSARLLVSAAAAVAATGLLVAQLVPGPAGHNGGGPGQAGILAPGSSGSLQHHSWWDPGGWADGGGAPKPRAIAGSGLPRASSRVTRHAAVAPPRRVGELTSLRTAGTRVYQLSDGRRQAVISAAR